MYFFTCLAHIFSVLTVLSNCTKLDLKIALQFAKNILDCIGCIMTGVLVILNYQLLRYGIDCFRMFCALYGFHRKILDIMRCNLDVSVNCRFLVGCLINLLQLNWICLVLCGHVLWMKNRKSNLLLLIFVKQLINSFLNTNRLKDIF